MNPTDLDEFRRIAHEFRRVVEELRRTRGVTDLRLAAIADSMDGDIASVMERQAEPLPQGGNG